MVVIDFIKGSYYLSLAYFFNYEKYALAWKVVDELKKQEQQ